MVDGQKCKGFNKLRLNGRGTHHDHGFLREHGCAFGHGVDITGKAEIAQIVEKFFTKQVLRAEIFDIFLIKVQIFNVVDQLFQTCGNGETATIRHGTEIKVKIRDAILVPGFEVTVAHGQLVKVTEHSHVQLLVCIHDTPRFLFGRHLPMIL